jgi:putative ABC transport system substrate-binding protein
MRRRAFVSLLGSGVIAWPFSALAQQSSGMRRIGVLMGYPETDAEAQSYFAAFRDSLRRLGWIDGRNIAIDIRWARPGDMISMERFAKELIAVQPDLILSNTTPTTVALLQQTRSIPLVFAMVADPIGSGFVTSFAQPGAVL